MGFLTSYIESTIELSFSTVFLVVFLLITYLVVRRPKGASNGWLLVASLVSASIATLAGLIVAACNSRDLWDENYDARLVTAQWFKGLANFSLMATIMIPVCGRVAARSKLGIIHTLLVGVLAILWICTLSINSEPTVYHAENWGLSKLVNYVFVPLRRSVTVFSVLVASFDMLRALARRMHLRNRVARTTIPLLACCQLGNALLEFLYPFAYVTGELAPFIFITFLWYLFPTGAFVCAWYVMSSPEISVDLLYTQVMPSPYGNASEGPSMEDWDSEPR